MRCTGTGADAGLSGRYSPASSVASNGPDVPTAPESPWMSDFYDSEVETDNPSRRHGGNRYASSSRENTVERPRTAPNVAAGGLSSASRQPGSPSTTNYMPYRSRNILDRGPYHWPTSAPSTLERTSADDRRSNTVPRDLYDIARRRRADDGAEADTGRLDDWINGLLSPSATTGPTSTSGPTATSGPASSNTLRAQSSSPLRSQPTTVTSAAQPRRVIDTKYPRSASVSCYIRVCICAAILVLLTSSFSFLLVGAISLRISKVSSSYYTSMFTRLLRVHMHNFRGTQCSI